MNNPKATISSIAYHLPEKILNNEQLAVEYPGWSAEKIEAKTGIRNRHIAAPSECASDLAIAASLDLFKSGSCPADKIDYVLFCTQSPDYFLPTTACLIQNRLGLSTQCGALDFNLGCSGFVSGLGLAKGLIETGQAENVLLITAETYSKHIHSGDKSVRTLFGDAAAATLVKAVESDSEIIGPMIYGTNGAGANNLIVPTGGLRKPFVNDAEIIEDENGNQRTVNNLFMNGPEIMNFTLEIIPQTVARLLEKSGKTLEQIDLFVFHQANSFILTHMRRKLKIPEEKLPIMMGHCGNTVSSSIPILLKDLMMADKLRPGQTLMLLGFGVGYSWSGAIVRWC